jgi:hypothetical protein
MRQLIIGVILTLWGLGIILRRLASDDAVAGAYGFGQNLALFMAFLMVAFGARAVVKHVRGS